MRVRLFPLIYPPKSFQVFRPLLWNFIFMARLYQKLDFHFTSVNRIGCQFFPIFQYSAVSSALSGMRTLLHSGRQKFRTFVIAARTSSWRIMFGTVGATKSTQDKARFLTFGETARCWEISISPIA